MKTAQSGATRHALTEALAARARESDPNASWDADFASPPEQFGEYLRAYAEGLQGSALRGAVYGHLLQNRIHIALSPQTAQKREAANHLLRAWAKQVLSGGGKQAAEYGVGKLRRPWADGLSDSSSSVRQAAQVFFDPLGRMGMGV